jgi:uncharacterized protein YjiS (DUF1127 family)
MSISSTLPGVIPSLGAARPAAKAPGAAPRRGVLAQCRDWLRRRDDAARLREMEPHLARDIGAAPSCNRGPEGFALDPRPLWGIGLTPRPMNETPPWSGNRRGG